MLDVGDWEIQRWNFDVLALLVALLGLERLVQAIYGPSRDYCPGNSEQERKVKEEVL